MKLNTAIVAVLVAAFIAAVMEDRSDVGQRLRRLELLTTRIATKLDVNTNTDN